MARLPIGIEVLDRRLNGGVPSGSIVFLKADPASQSEVFLYELTRARGTLYITTVRSDQSVRDAFDRTPARTGSPTVREVGAEDALDETNRLVSTLPESANLIIDTVDQLERSEPNRYRRVLNDLQTQMMNTGGLAILHGMKSDHEPENRTVTEQMADIVFDLRTDIRGGEVINRLAVPKFRGGIALDETVKLKLEESVAIDTSRDIA